MAKILSVFNRLQAGDYENGNGGKRRVSRLTQFIHATLQMLPDSCGLAKKYGNEDALYCSDKRRIGQQLRSNHIK